MHMKTVSVLDWKRSFVLGVGFLLTACGTSVEAQTVANSLAELRSLASQSNVDVVLAPGEYWLEGDGTNPNFLDFSGSNSTFDLSGAQIKLDTRDLAGYGNNSTTGAVRPITVTGSNNVVQGLNFSGHDVELDTDPNARRHADRSAVYLQVTGSDNRIQDATLLVRGSSPYGYGDVFGKGARFPESGQPVEEGGFAFLSHNKTSSFLVTGDAQNTIVDNLDLTSEAYGHGFFVQGSASNTTIRNSTLTGQLVSGNDAIAHPEYQEYAAGADGVLGTADDGGTRSGTPLPENIFLSAQEDGIRSYTGSGSLTVQNTTVTNFRSGVHSTFANGNVIVDNVDIRGTENAFITGSNTTITNSTADIVNGPAIYVQYNDDRNTTIDLEIVGEVPEGVDWAVAYLNGENFDVTLRSDLAAGFLPEDSLVRYGQTWFNNWRDQLRPTGPETASPGPFTNSTFTNLTNEYAVLGEAAEGNVGSSQAGVISNGKENYYDGVTVVLEGSRLTVTDTKGLGNSGTETGAVFSGGNIVHTGTATAQTFDDNGTVVADGATLEIGAGISVVDEKLTITGDGVDGRGALFSQGDDRFRTRFGDTNSSNESFIVLDGDSSIGVGTSGNTLVVGQIQGVGDLTKKGAGSLIIGKASTYDGNFTIEQGHVATRRGVVHSDLSIAAGASLGQISGNGLDTNGDITLDGTLDLNQRSDVGILSATIGRLDGGGRITLSNTNSSAGGRLTFDGNGADGNFTGQIDDAVSLIKSGSNAQTLSGNLSYTGTTTVNEGDLLIDGTHTGGGDYSINGGLLGGGGTIASDVFLNSGRVAPGAGGLTGKRLNINGNLTQASGSTIELGSYGSSHDALEISGTASVAGTLALSSVNNSGLQVGQSLSLLNAAQGISGEFSSIEGVAIGQVSGFSSGLAIVYDDTEISARVSILGDADFSNGVDNSDVGRVFANFQAVFDPTWEDGNFDGNNTVDNSDIGIVFANFGEEVTSFQSLLSAKAISAVFEPTFADLIYDPLTGRVVLDGTDAAGGVITNFVLDSDGSFLNTDDLGDPFGSPFLTTNAGEVSASDGSALGLDLIDLGYILEAGLTSEDLDNLFTTSSYVGELGSGRFGFDFVIATAVPEPSSGVVLLGLGMAYITRRKRS